MTDIKLRLEQRKAQLLKAIETAARAAESNKLPGLTSDLQRVEALLVKHEALVVEVDSLLAGSDAAKGPTVSGKALKMMRSEVEVRGGG